jgi:SAM-dependent methyltransferase
MQDNSQQIEFWNGPSGERWASLNEVTERSLSFITAALIPFAGAKPGDHELDLGCGCASTSLAFARAVGTAGSVTGVDISRPMLEVAKRRARESGAKIEFIEADASAYAFKPDYDLIFSRFGVMFFADPAQAFANIRNALKPGGRLAFVCWRTLAENTWATRPLAAAVDLLPPQPPADPHAPGPFAFAERDRLVSILSRAGFRDAAAEALDTVMNMGATLDDAVSAALSVGPLARAAGELTDDVRNKVRERVRHTLAEYKTPAGITPPAACWLVSARA